MRYFLAFILPPLAILLCGRPLMAIVNVPLCFLGWVPGVAHALLVVHEHLADKRATRVIRELRSAH
ncbi:MAG: YqaE/Pmp3 family membrane protein [Candidatus Sumerlaeia bacterium]|nr:YqaE/Pmp3 family membrane protein [Candidatus Sumerlaeia bacterium]